MAVGVGIGVRKQHLFVGISIAFFRFKHPCKSSIVLRFICSKNSLLQSEWSEFSANKANVRANGLKSALQIPNSVTRIGEFALSDCDSLTQIVVAKGNSVYHSAGNCLIESKSKTLIAGCKSSVIPTDGSVTGIDDYAFYNCRNLTSISIPSSVKSIGVAAFSGCSKLTSIIIPFSIVSIGVSAFGDWQSSQTIYCQATSQPNTWDSDWNYGCSAKIVWGA